MRLFLLLLIQSTIAVASLIASFLLAVVASFLALPPSSCGSPYYEVRNLASGVA
jgi:hypothetical protein